MKTAVMLPPTKTLSTIAAEIKAKNNGEGGKLHFFLGSEFQSPKEAVTMQEKLVEGLGKLKKDAKLSPSLKLALDLLPEVEIYAHGNGATNTSKFDKDKFTIGRDVIMGASAGGTDSMTAAKAVVDSVPEEISSGIDTPHLPLLTVEGGSPAEDKRTQFTFLYTERDKDKVIT